MTQETVTSLEKRTDLRIEGRSERDEIVIVELKLAGNWTGDVLMRQLEQQLLDQYLISRRVRHGIYLLIELDHPSPWTLEGRAVSFETLVDRLTDRAAALQLSQHQVDRIEVLGLRISQPPRPARTPKKKRVLEAPA